MKVNIVPFCFLSFLFLSACQPINEIKDTADIKKHFSVSIVPKFGFNNYSTRVKIFQNAWESTWKLVREENKANSISHVLLTSENFKDEFIDEEVQSGKTYKYILNKGAEYFSQEVSVPEDFEVKIGSNIIDRNQVFGRIFFKDNSKLLLNAPFISLDAEEIVSNGGIIETGPEVEEVRVVARKGIGNLTILATGKNGVKGRKGKMGASGEKGKNGNVGKHKSKLGDEHDRITYSSYKALEGLGPVAKQLYESFYCALPPSQGNRGGDGNKGESGENGSSGADSPKLYLEVKNSNQFKLFFRPMPGIGGDGGDGGEGGNGGQGGDAGELDELRLCPPASKGMQGNPGPLGEKGVKGSDGKIGEYCVRLGEFTKGNCTFFDPIQKN